MKKTISLVAAFTLFYTCAPEKGIPVEHSQACNLENNDKVLEVSGYLADEGSVYCSSTSGRFECGFQLINDLQSKKGFSVNIKVGSSSNSVENLESGYSRKDIKIHDDNGNLISLDKKVTVTGKIRTVNDPDIVCYLKVNRIEVR
jgi:hypothetical protein